MSAKILRQQRIGTDLFWFLGGCDFNNSGVQFRVIGSESTGPGIYDVTHTIKMLNPGHTPISQCQNLSIYFLKVNDHNT